MIAQRILDATRRFVRAAARRVLRNPIRERLHAERAKHPRAGKARLIAEKPRSERKRLYWAVNSPLRAVLGDGRLRIRMPHDVGSELDIEDTRSDFRAQLRVDPASGRIVVRVERDGELVPIGEFANRRMAAYSILRALIEHTEPTGRDGVPGPTVWVPIVEGRVVPRLLRLDMAAQWTSPLHRSGWAGAMETIASLHHDQGVIFDGFLESTFIWKDTGRVYREPWVGVSHSPPNTPEWLGTNEKLLDNERMRQSLAHCRGLFVLSSVHREALLEHVDVPISVIPLPTDTPQVTFSVQAFEANPLPRLVQVGKWLRNPNSLYQLQSKGLRKTRLDLGHPWEEEARMQLPPVEGLDLDSVAVLPRLSADAYDELLSCNLVFLDLLDSSANNAIVECIVRGTPVLVNRHPAVAEYLGADYPFYFDDLEEAARKVDDVDLVRRTHRYLRELPKDRFTREGFLHAVVTSEVYQSLPPAGSEKESIPGTGTGHAGAPVRSSNRSANPLRAREAGPFRDPSSRVMLFHGSHHKAGTHWLLRILRRVAKRYDMEVGRPEGPLAAPHPDILIDPHSESDLSKLPRLRGSHMVRDPRDMVVSGYFYHLWTEEAWAREADPRYDGRSYQEHLKELDLEDGLIAEIGHCAFTFDLMARWNYDDPRIFELRYEDLMAEGEPLFRRLFEHYEFGDEAVTAALAIAHDSRFEALAKRSVGSVEEGSVLRSGRPEQWREHFTPRVRQTFQEAAGDLLVQLGYERDDRW